MEPWDKTELLPYPLELLTELQEVHYARMQHSYLATWQEVDVSILILRSSNTGSGHAVVIHWPSFGRVKLNKTLTSMSC